MFSKSTFFVIRVETLQPGGDFSAVQNAIYCFIISTSSAQSIVFITFNPLSPICFLSNHAKMAEIEGHGNAAREQAVDKWNERWMGKKREK